jgi:hypothetical protein
MRDDALARPRRPAHARELRDKTRRWICWRTRKRAETGDEDFWF